MNATDIDNVFFHRYGLINPEFKKNKNWVKVTRIALQFFVSKPIGDLFFNVGAYRKLSFKAKKIEEEIEKNLLEQVRKQRKNDFVELEKVSNKKQIASVIRAGLVFNTVSSLGYGFMHGSSFGIVVPLVATAFLDKKSIAGVGDACLTGFMYGCAALAVAQKKHLLSLTPVLALRSLGLYMGNRRYEKTWVDRTAAILAGIQQ